MIAWHARLGLCFVAPCFVLSACGDDGGVVPPTDSGVPDADAAASAVADPPEIPWLSAGAPPLELTPCPDGWREVTNASGVTTCDPYPEEGRADCGPGEAHFPGEPGCSPVGVPCPTTPFPEAPVDGAVVYVDASAADGGDGSSSAPFDDLSDVAWAALGRGTTVVLAKGSYPGSVNLRPGVRLLGACAAETVLTGDTLPTLAVVQAQAAGDPARLEHVAIRSVPKWGIFVQGGATLNVTGVITDRTERAAILANGPGTAIVLEDVLVSDTRAGADGRLGFGIEAAGGASITTERVLFAGNRGAGVRVSEPGTTVRLVDSAVVDTLPEPATGAGNGIEVLFGASVVAERVAVVGGAVANLAVAGGRIELTDGFLAEAGTFGFYAEGGGSVRLERVVATSSHETLGGGFVNEASRGELVDVVVRGYTGWGLASLMGELDASRVVVEQIDGLGVSAEGLGARITLTDSVVRDVRETGIDASEGASLAASRVEVTRATAAGAMAIWGGTLDLTDVAIRGALPASGFGDRYGMGLIAFERGSVVNGHRVLVEDTYEQGIVAYPGSRMTLSNLTVRDVLPTASGVDVRTSGFAVAAFSAELTLERFHLADAATCGLMVADANEPDNRFLTTSVDLSMGLVTGMPIGACVQVEGYDVNRLSTDVLYQDNGTNLDATALPIPDSADFIPPM